MDVVDQSAKKFAGAISVGLRPERTLMAVLWASLMSLMLLGAVRAGAAESVTLAWNANPEANLTGYHLHYGQAPRQYSVRHFVRVPTTTFTVTDLVPGQAYYFAVTALTADGLESDYSDELPYVVPSTPGGQGQPTITWPTPAPIAYGTPLSTAQLNATANVPGVFVYYPPVGTMLSPGGRALTTVFTPLDLLNYRVVTNTVVLDVLRASLTVRANNASKVYGQANPPLTVTYSGFLNGDTAAVLDVPASVSTTASGGSSVGSYPITPSGGSDGFYALTYVSGSLTITPASLVIGASDSSKVYGQSNPAFTANYLGFVNGDNPSSLDVAPTVTTTATANSPAGNYPMTASGASDLNYSIRYVGGTFTVARAPLTIRADNKIREAGQANPVLTATYIGFMNGDTAAVLDTPVSLSTTATAASAPGYYPITASGASDGNYAISHASGTLTVSNNFRVLVNFQPATSPTPSGYLKDDGAVFASRGNGQTYGWNAANTAFMVDRDSSRSPDQRYDTFAQMQSGGGSMWEVAVPNGRYRVLVVAGDAVRHDSVYSINVEGIPTVGGNPNPNMRWISGSNVVNVTDGRLTISNGSGASNNKICFVDIIAELPPMAGGGANQLPFSSARIVGIQRNASGWVTLQLQDADASRYAVESSTDLVNWDEIGVVANTGNNLLFDDGPTAAPQRFFRVVAAQ